MLEEGENKFGTSDELRDPSSDGVAMEKEHIPQRKKVDRHFPVHVPEPKLMSKINSVEDSPRLLGDILVVEQVSDTKAGELCGLPPLRRKDLLSVIRV